VIYLPDPQFQDVAVAGPDEVVSTRLDPGVDPVAEARRRGTVLLVIRMGNIDLEAPNTPHMEAPNPYMAPPMPRTVPPNGRPLPTAPRGPMPPGAQGAIMGPQGPIMTPQGPITGPQMPLTSRQADGPEWAPPAPPTSSAPTSSPTVTTLPAPLDAPPSVGGSQTTSTPDATSFERKPSLRRRLFSGSGDN